MIDIIGHLERQEAIIILLSYPDPPDLKTPNGVGRSYRYTRAGDFINKDQIKHDLALAYVVNRGPDVSGIISVRRQPRNRIATC